MGFFDKLKKIAGRKRAAGDTGTPDPACPEENPFSGLQVFISCPAKDNSLGRGFKEQLVKKGCHVFFAPDSIQAGWSYTSVIEKAMAEAAENGLIIVMITPESMRSLWIQHEIASAFYQNGNIVPVLVGNVELSDTMRFYFGDRQILHLPENPSEAEIGRVIDSMVQMKMK